MEVALQVTSETHRDTLFCVSRHESSTRCAPFPRYSGISCTTWAVGTRCPHTARPPGAGAAARTGTRARGLLGPVVLALCPAPPGPAAASLSRPWGIGTGGLSEPAAVSAAAGPGRSAAGGARPRRARGGGSGAGDAASRDFLPVCRPEASGDAGMEPPGCRSPGPPSAGASSGGARARPGRQEAPGREPAPGPRSQRAGGAACTET